MSDRPGGEPNQEPTPKRLERAYKEGETAWSTRIVAAIQFSVFLLIFSAVIKSSWNLILEFGAGIFSGKTTVNGIHLVLYDRILAITLPVIIAIGGATLAAGFLQIGFRFNIHRLQPKLSNLSPVRGIKQIFSLKRVTDMLLSLFFIVFVLILLTETVWNHRKHFVQSALNQELGNIGVYTDIIFSFSTKLLVFTIIFAAVDWFIIYRRYRQNLMMTRYEVEKEMKQDEGDANIKSQRRQMHAELSMSEGIKAVKEADIVIVNPTKIAVALKSFDGSIPQVVASGENANALKIRKEAEKHGVPVYRDVHLARNLKSINVGSEIPQELFDAIAIILATIEKDGTV
ncbi:EscU/YscU/HrcU family type III secretion system export apparatus switch protein [Myxococcota bacterium]|nr:EscU/YscU/HrcU family type III secretion system export apparatus switch protein [Myxococcota bacterium]MBU1382132.1 EscU/YscU/HrcU family type III secretion system export apparatus switch protein [Myxococcota bacterium]MBU1498134.1 EscU/YscU/HrcU family type III secretion system export apparatus switch protein [Myxococcota bacterium]